MIFKGLHLLALALAAIGSSAVAFALPLLEFLSPTPGDHRHLLCGHPRSVRDSFRLGLA